ncbi:hypothetical protein QQF64_001961 [Cirrhinus molitorella]|uniref:Uncharacterized protein n=2 Tax=Cirrhinus molitorella TaxID=172907 RepID=A0ABR3MNU6_9TELE|nr:hypothetical protein Q8A67_023407 [Cirrhinus molitorella]
MNKMTLNQAVNLTSDNITLLPYYIHSAGLTVMYIFSYMLVLLLSVVGNGLVCLVVFRNRKMHSVTNLFIVNLAISDLLVGVICVPTTLTDSLISGWPFSQITCTLSNLIQGMSVSASVFTLTAIAVDRFTKTVYHHHLRPVTALFTIIFIWLLAFAIIFPSAATMTVIRLDNMYLVHDNQMYPLCICFEDWAKAVRRVYTLVIFIPVYLAPLVLISLMYGCIAGKLSNNLRENRVQSRKKIKVIRMLIMVAFLFIVSWLPLWILMLLTDYQDLDRQQTDFLSSYLFPVAHWLAFFNSGINPIIYGFFNENFRRGFQATVGFSSCRSFLTEMRHMLFSLVPPNRVSDKPEDIGQGILLEDIPQVSHRVLEAWIE